jgi:hypothetical protein
MAGIRIIIRSGTLVAECLGISSSPSLSRSTGVEVVVRVNVVTSANFNSVVVRSFEGKFAIIARFVDIEALLLSIRILNVKFKCGEGLGT